MRRPTGKVSPAREDLVVFLPFPLFPFAMISFFEVKRSSFDLFSWSKTQENKRDYICGSLLVLSIFPWWLLLDRLLSLGVDGDSLVAVDLSLTDL